MQEFAQLIEFFLLLRLQLELIVIKVDAADLDTRNFLLGYCLDRRFGLRVVQRPQGIIGVGDVGIEGNYP